MGKIKDILGLKVGMLTVIKYAGKNKDHHALWTCLCECGNTKDVLSRMLCNGQPNSCGCHTAQVTHGMSHTKEHRAWAAMRNRCYNTNNKRFRYYGGRGITVCDRWKDSFENFLEDMGLCPDKRMSVDRIDNSKNYTQENCHWATWTEQSRNRSNTVFLTAGGITRPIGEWSDITGVRRGAIYRRMHSGWTPEEAIYGKKMAAHA
jgi:hypothetical protein